jgi:hypothetical protein
MTDLDELERLLEQATPGPWIGAGPSFGDPLPRYTTDMVTEWEDDDGHSPTICEFGYAHHDEENEANAALIAALRNHAEELVRDARRYRWLCDNRCVPWSDVLDNVHNIGIDAAIDAAIAQEQPPDVPETDFGNMAGGD